MPDELPAGTGQSAAWTLAPKRRNLFSRLWHGELSLGVTYWVFGVLIGNVIGAMLYLAAAAQTSVPAALSFVAPVIAYSIFMAVAIWRSAKRYRATKQRRILASLAQFAALMSVLSAIGSVSHLLPGLEPDEDLQSAIDTENKNAPKMVEDGLRFEKASRVRRVFFYDFTLTKVTADQISATAKDQVSPTLQKNACNNSGTKRLLLSLDRMVYRFQDRNGRPAFQVDLTKADCP